MNSSRSRKKLTSRKYAHAYLQQLQDLLLATQIRVLRKQRKLSQSQLARITGMKQARISLLENGSYSQWSLATLRAFAEALDVGLDVRFTSYFDLVDRMERESTESLEVAKRADELRPEYTTTVASSVRKLEMNTFSTHVSPIPETSHWETYRTWEPQQILHVEMH
jgi:transcriptional regulator with XRE-family HTH domain